MTDHGLGTASSAPRAWPARAVALATLALPAGPVRERYRLEITAELYGMERRQQARHALGVLSSAWALRRAVRNEPVVREERQMRRPTLCRLNLHHVWRTRSAEDGTRNLRCIKCGKDYPDSGSGPLDWMGGMTPGN